MTIQENICRLTGYAKNCGLISKEDEIYTVNRLLELFELDEMPESALEAMNDAAELEVILKEMLDYAYEAGVMKSDDVTSRDLFDTKMMGLLMPRPGEVIRTFNEKYEKSPKEATDYYYKLSQDSDYIRRYRIKKDMKWVTKTPYGDIDMTINLSKPEKDPKAIAAALKAKASAYPKCLLCKENEGYAGRMNHPARQNHRVIPMVLNNEKFFMQYSPYVYYNEHCIAFNSEHVPMKIDRSAFMKLFDFVTRFPHYFIGSNADLPIVGGSILTHDHFQGGCYEFAMAKAPVETEVTVKGFEDVHTGIVKWPMSVIRISHESKERLTDLAEKILNGWRGYTDADAYIFAETDGVPHNTITPIARRRGDLYEMDLVLRNNITTEECPDGLYHPHKEFHHIKKENIGLIEVMGLAVLPARLKTEMQQVKQCILDGKNVADDENIAKHAAWVEEIKEKYDHINEENIDDIFNDEIGYVFAAILEQAGVYKRNEAGKTAFLKFIEQI